MTNDLWKETFHLQTNGSVEESETQLLNQGIEGVEDYFEPQNESCPSDDSAEDESQEGESIADDDDDVGKLEPVPEENGAESDEETKDEVTFVGKRKVLKLAQGNFQLERVGAVVRAFASHQCDPGSIPGPNAISELSLCWLSTLLRGFSFGFSGIPPSAKTSIQLIPAGL